MCVSGFSPKKSYVWLVGIIILFYQNMLYRNCIFHYIFHNFSADLTIFCLQFTVMFRVGKPETYIYFFFHMFMNHSLWRVLGIRKTDVWSPVNLQGDAAVMVYCNCHFCPYLMSSLVLNVMSWVGYESRHDKTNKMSVRPAKIQISLGIRPV